jgi:hypothetical protein
MKSKLLSFIESHCEDNRKAVDNRFCTYLDIYRFEQENGLSREGCENLLRELFKENKICFGRLLNGYYIRKK